MAVRPTRPHVSGQALASPRPCWLSKPVSAGSADADRSRPSLPGLWSEAAELVWASVVGYLTLPQPDRKVGVAPPPFLPAFVSVAVPTAQCRLPLGSFAGATSVAPAWAQGWEHPTAPPRLPRLLTAAVLARFGFLPSFLSFYLH